MTEDPHSAQFLTDARDGWWHDDWLRLLAARVRLHEVARAVDVGAGHGHWTRTVARLLPRGASITGVEREPAWVARAAAGPPVDGVDLRYVTGTAERLPCDDASVDLVTCQTVLIHVADPRAALAEWARVLKPGGLLLCAEPNNLGQCISPYAALPDVDPDDLAAAVRLQALCERGKRALGLGDISLGERLPGLIDDALYAGVQAWICDRARLARPPYDDAARAALADERRWHDEGGGVGWPLDETRRYYDAGGGAPGDFAELCARARRLAAQRFQAIDAGQYAACDGSLLYVVAARRR